MEKEESKRRKEEANAELEKGEEEKERAVVEFERVMMGLEGRGKVSASVEGSGGKDAQGRGVKRKFELDEEEMLRNAREERAKARKALDEEKVGRTSLIQAPGHRHLHERPCWASLPLHT